MCQCSSVVEHLTLSPKVSGSAPGTVQILFPSQKTVSWFQGFFLGFGLKLHLFFS